MPFEPRNPGLYMGLKQAFGRVKVQNHGVPFRYKSVPEPGGHRKIVKLSSGEEYSTCCNLCGDRRFRLNINHVFGTRIEGVLMEHVAHCWNEDCDVLPELRPIGMGGSKVVISEAFRGTISAEAVATDSSERFKRLNELVRIDRLPDAHPAREYLAGRNLPPDVLGAHYGVAYCNDPDPSVSIARFRIVFPLYYIAAGSWDMIPVGWQARAIPGFSPRQDPKYWTSPGCMRGYFMYMYPWALPHEGLVLVEGPTDAHTIGPPACATLGRRVTMHQRALIVDGWAHRTGTVVLIGDPGFEEDWAKNYDELRQELGDHRVVLFVPEADSNKLGTAEIHRRIRYECANRGLSSPV